jgi:inorganic pyrophosphatase/exopolyphosphatase
MELNFDHIFLNVIDVVKKTSMIVAPEFETQKILKQAIKADFKNNYAHFHQILLRKTDLLPQLQALFTKI